MAVQVPISAQILQFSRTVSGFAKSLDLIKISLALANPTAEQTKVYNNNKTFINGVITSAIDLISKARVSSKDNIQKLAEINEYEKIVLSMSDKIIVLPALRTKILDYDIKVLWLFQTKEGRAFINQFTTKSEEFVKLF